ncbi:MAG: hypothetical protein AAGA92_07275 [Planctomycetota bacterium]
MSTTAPIQMQPPDDADGDSADYRSISGAAVVALVLGLASPLNFVSPPLIVVPVAAVGCALLAYRSIAASGGGLAGRALATVGLALAAFCAAAAPTHQYTRDGRYRSQAEETAERWLTNMAAGDAEAVGGLTTLAAIRKLTPEQPTGLPAIGPSGPVVTNYARLLSGEPIAEALESVSGGETPGLRCVDAELAFLKGRIQCLMLFDVNGPGQETPVQVSVSALRPTIVPDAVWLIDEWRLIE